MKKSQKFILAIDQSTSATKVILFNKNGEVVARKNNPHQQFYPHDGFVEHDPMEIFENTIEGIHGVLEENKMNLSDIHSIAITNQRETAMIWDKNTGVPVANAAVWQCQRGAGYCDKIRSQGLGKMISEKTGLIIDPYFSASKLHWMMNNISGLKEKAQQGALLFGTMDSWLLWKLTNGKVHATDYSNACRTMLFNINSLSWDSELIELFDLHESMFPEVKFSNEIFGFTDIEKLPGESIPVSGLLGDSHAALFGQHCFSTGMGKATYGTGSSIMMNIGKQALEAPEGLVTSIGFGLKPDIHYVFEGNIHCTGDTINWLKNELALIIDASETEPLALKVEDTNGVYFVPAFVGLGAPYWDNEARASITGMSRNTTKAHLVRAALESIAYQIKDLIDLMDSKGNITLKEIRVDGGPTKNNFLMQFQSDMLNLAVNKSEIEEVSALGATFMAGLATGYWKDLDEIAALRKDAKVYQPKFDDTIRSKYYRGWKKAVERTRL